MRQQTILILDSQQQRGGILEHGLTSRGYHVFRTTRSREASKLLHVLQPHFLVVALEGDGREFYQQVVLPEQVGTAQCVVLAPVGIRGLRAVDTAIDITLPAAKLLDVIVQNIQQGVGSSEPAPEQNLTDGKTVMQLRPFDASTMNPQVVAKKPSTATPGPRPPSSDGSAVSPPSNWTQSGVTGNREWAGTLDKLDVARILAILTRQQASGRLDLRTGIELRSVWMDRGVIVAAQSNQPVRSLAMLLVQDGVLQQRDVDAHPEFGLPEGARLLLEMGKIQAHQVEEVERWYVEQLLLSSFGWQHGDFHFFPGDEQNVQHITSIPLAPLILQGVREGYQLERLALLLGGGDRVPQWFANRTPENFLPLQGVEKQIVDLIDGQRALDMLRATMRVEPRLLYSLVYVLMILGYIRMRESATVSPHPISQGRTVPPASSTMTPAQPHNVPPSALTSTVTRPAADASTTFTPNESAALQTGQARNPPAMSYRSVMPAQRQSARASMQLRPEKHAGMPLKPAGQQTSPEELQVTRQKIEQKFYQVMTDNYFQVLELTPEAQEVDIRRAYQRIKHSFANERFVTHITSALDGQLHEIQQVLEEAYAVLSDPQLRFRYMSHLA